MHGYSMQYSTFKLANFKSNVVKDDGIISHLHVMYKLIILVSCTVLNTDQILLR